MSDEVWLNERMPYEAGCDLLSQLVNPATIHFVGDSTCVQFSPEDWEAVKCFLDVRKYETLASPKIRRKLPKRVV